MEHNKVDVANFFSTISPWEAAYTHAVFSYFAEEIDGKIQLVFGRLYLNVAPSNPLRNKLKSGRFHTGCFYLSEVGLGYRETINQLVETGTIKTPTGELQLPVKDSKINTYFIAFHQDGLNTGARIPYLRIEGAHKHILLHQPNLDWELKSAKEPFDSLAELLAEFSLLGCERFGNANVEIIAHQVAAIKYDSKVEETLAQPEIILAKSLDKKKCHIGYRVFKDGRVTQRGSVDGKNIKWVKSNKEHRGIAKIKIPQGAALNCVAVYDGCAHHNSWITDPKHFQNPRRNIIEELDAELKDLRFYLFEEKKQGKGYAREFEQCIAILIWMLGFSPAQTNTTNYMPDAPDIIATTPQGHVLVVECTTGPINPNNKLTKLAERAKAIKKRLEASGYGHLHSLPVIVTTKPKIDIVATDLSTAQSLGIAVVAKETLIESLSQSIVSPDAETVFNNLKESVLLSGLAHNSTDKSP